MLITDYFGTIQTVQQSAYLGFNLCVYVFLVCFMQPRANSWDLKFYWVACAVTHKACHGMLSTHGCRAITRHV